MRTLRLAAIAAALTFVSPVSALADEKPTPTQSPKPAEKCEHGVKKSLCTRCNPKLAAVFKAKGDWCAEHERPESQCVLCHPELAKEGVK